MNIFGKSLEEIQTNTSSLVESIDPFPGLPDKLSLKDVAFIFGISVQTINRMIESGDLKQAADGFLYKADLEAYISCHTLADIPVLDSPETIDYPTKDRKIPTKN